MATIFRDEGEKYLPDYLLPVYRMQDCFMQDTAMHDHVPQDDVTGCAGTRDRPTPFA